MTKIQVSGYHVVLSDINSFWEHVGQLEYSSLFVLVDENTEQHCLPILQKQNHQDRKFDLIKIQSGEINKNIITCQSIWEALIANNADRNSLLVNLGGGVIGDMGGFCASTYMRGIRFIQIPTTLLSQVDASVGGKLGIDHKSLKNVIGLFKNPEMVFVDKSFLKTLSERQLMSGFAEIFKHALIKDKLHWEKLTTHKNIASVEAWEDILKTSIKIKKEVVEKDPLESGYRKILNFGHTIGHGIESHFLESNDSYLHGEAIALGMICEAYLSHKKNHLDLDALNSISNVLLSHYPLRKIETTDFNPILSILRKDKKNDSGKILLSLLSKIGHCDVNIECNADDIKESLRYFNTLNK